MNLEQELREYLNTKDINNKTEFISGLRDLVKRYPTRQFTRMGSCFTIAITENFKIVVTNHNAAVVYKNKRCLLASYMNVIYYSKLNDLTMYMLNESFNNNIDKFVSSMMYDDSYQSDLSIDWLFLSDQCKSARK